MKRTTERPEHLAGFIDMALELDALKECGATFRLDDLSEGQWCTLLALNQGRIKANNEKAEAERAKYEREMRQRK